jgi:hypothetical protein
MDWEAVKRRADELGLQPLLHKHLSGSSYAPHVPADLQRCLEASYRKHSISNLRVYGQLISILACMNRLEIPIVVLKGAFLARWIYGDIGLRPMNDIDILIRKSDEEVVRDAMISLGYHQDSTVYHTPFHERVRTADDDHLRPFYKPKAQPVEVHVNLFSRLGRGPDEMERVWEKAVLSELDGVRMNLLSPEYQLLYLCTHLYYHLGSDSMALYWFCDLHELINRSGHDPVHRIDWNEFRRLADTLGVGAQTGSVLELLRANWQTPIPELELYCKEPRTGFCLTSIIRGQTDVKRQRANLVSEYAVDLKFTGQVEGWRDRFYYIWKLIFPSRIHLMRRYKVTNPWVGYLCYLLLPFSRCRNLAAGLWYKAMLFRGRRNPGDPENPAPAGPAD